MSLPAVSLADYFGLEVIDRSDLTICQDASDPDIPFKLSVCEIHVVFDNAADRLISVAFSNVSTTDPAGFYQHTFGGDTAPGCALLTAIPTLVCDSFVTLGEECAVGGSSTDPDFDSTGFNSSGTVSGGWFNSAPANGQGDPDANGRVMIARFSYKQNKTTSGDVCVFTKLAGSQVITEFLLVPFDCAVPGGGFPEGCGDENAGSCFAGGNGTPSCDCAACCTQMCGVDPFCCDVEWDDQCSFPACLECDLTLCRNCNDTEDPDGVDIAKGTSLDCNGNGIPDECEIDLAAGEEFFCVPLACDTICDDCADSGPGCDPQCVITCDPDCNGNGVPDECDEDCNVNGVPDDCDVSSGRSLDCNSNNIPDECEEDCNLNGKPDDCDITSGESDDTDGNGIPDECQTEDCNFNGIVDVCDTNCGSPGGVCDVSGCGLLPDCDGNGLLDVCETVLRGPMFLSGHDADDGGHCWGIEGACGDLYGQLLSYAVQKSRVESGLPEAPRKLLAIGVNGEPEGPEVGSDAFEALKWFNDTANQGPGAEIDIVTDPAVIGDPLALNFNDYSAIYIPSTNEIDETTDGGINDAQLAALNSRQADIQDFVEVQKGGLLALTEVDAGGLAYGWLPVPLQTMSRDHDDASPTDTLNMILSNPVTGADISPNPYHAVFTGPEGFLGLQVLADSVDPPVGEILILGEVRSILGADCDANEVPDKCDIDENSSAPGGPFFCDPAVQMCDPDCNINGIPDECDIASGFSLDINLDGVPDECEGCGVCPTDVNGDGITGPLDLATLLGAWGPTGPGNCLDANGDLNIGPLDLATLLGAWGPCTP